MTPVQDAEQSVDEHVPTPIEKTSSDVLGDVTWDEFMSFDNELAVTNNNDGDWEDRIIAKALLLMDPKCLSLRVTKKKMNQLSPNQPLLCRDVSFIVS